MSRTWRGSLNNRLEENRQFCEEIKVGTGVTEYFYSDRHAFEVVAVKDQKHVSIREYDHKSKGAAFSNEWELISNEKNPVLDVVKRGAFWYVAVEITPERAAEIYYGTDIDAKLWAIQNGFILPDIIAAGKKKTAYHRRNLSFGVADYYFDYEF
jgi:hypothetical protein